MIESLDYRVAGSVVLLCNVIYDDDMHGRSVEVEPYCIF